MIGKIQIVRTQGTIDPVWHLDQRRALNIATHAPIHMRHDDWAISETRNAGGRGGIGERHIGEDSRCHHAAEKLTNKVFHGQS